MTFALATLLLLLLTCSQGSEFPCSLNKFPIFLSFPIMLFDCSKKAKFRTASQLLKSNALIPTPQKYLLMFQCPSRPIGQADQPDLNSYLKRKFATKPRFIV